ncbi:MAG: efflux RND transporter permease subunit [Planctomycetota bacterium]
MNFIAGAVRQPVTVAVGVVLVVLSGIVAFGRIPIQLTPNVEDTIVAVTTRWEGASPIEVEQEIVDRQEEKLQGIANLKAITSKSSQGQGLVRLEFGVGTPKEEALREVSDKLREVPQYPEGVDEPVIAASDPENRDYIAWVILRTDAEDYDIRELQDFAEDRMKPALERIPGMSEVNVLGGREREVQVRYDPELLAAKGITAAQFAAALRRDNRDVSAGALEQNKSDVRVRVAGQYEEVGEVENTVVGYLSGAPVYVRDVAEVVPTYKEARTFVRSRGQQVLAINFQKEVGANVIEVMDGLKAQIERMNAPGGLLDVQARKIGLPGKLWLEQAYDQTIYIDDALALVRDNIWIGGALAVLVLLLFLRNVRTVGIIALAIPISIVGAVVAMVALGRSINVISLAGMAFAVGMVVDNAIVVLENIFRHIEMGKPPLRASIDGGKEVFGAVVAATLTTVVVFIPILLIEEEAGQLFRDISLAIVAAVALSLLVSVTVIPTTAARILRAKKRAEDGSAPARKRAFFADGVAGLVHRLNGSVIVRIALVAALTVASVVGTAVLMPPTDYLPTGNRNLVFGLLIPPPNYSTDQQLELAHRIEASIRPQWEIVTNEPGSDGYEKAMEERIALPPHEGEEGPLHAPGLDNYFVVSFDGVMFHGAISNEPQRIADVVPLFYAATNPAVVPGVYAFAFQLPLFRLGGTTGSAIKINLSGDDLDAVARGAVAVLQQLMGKYGPGTVQPDPSNFNVPTPELRFLPDRTRLAEAGLTFEDVAAAVQSLGDGAIVGEFRDEGDAIDLKLIAKNALEDGALDRVAEAPIATDDGRTLPVGSVATPLLVNAPQQINRVGRQRSITLQFTPPQGVPLGQAIDEVAAVLESARASGALGPDIDSSFSGSASKLAAVQNALLGDGTLRGILGSSLVLALLVVYLMMCVLFQSFALPLVIMFSVPLATLGGFGALALVHEWSLSDPYLPIQKLDVLTMLGFVILIGVVVNNAILIVHQTLNFMRPAGPGEEDEQELHSLPVREAITESVRSRVRPIFMSTLTSVLGMAPLVLMPGSGSELYRGLGSVVVGGLMVSTIFTLVLVPLLLSLVLQVRGKVTGRSAAELANTGMLGTVAGILVAVALPMLGGCSSTKVEPRWDTTSERVAREVLDGVGETSPVTMRFAPSQVDELLDARRAELDAIGGPRSYEDLEVVLGEGVSGSEPEHRELTLDRAVELALANNLGLRRKRLEPDAARETLTERDAIYDTVLFADLEYERIDAPRPVPIIGGVTLGSPVNGSDRVRLQSGVRKLLSSGATVSATGFVERYDSRSPGISYLPDPAYRAGVTLEATQPLLRGYGDEVTSAERELAERAVHRSDSELESDALSLAAVVTQAYWNLAEAQARLEIQQLLVERGEAIVQVLERRRSFDTDAAQYADALATVEQRRADLVRARLLVERSSDELATLLDADEAALASDVLVVATDTFQLAPLTLDLRTSIETALERRPELDAALLDIEDASLRERLAANTRDPRLDLVARLDALGEDDGVGPAFSSLTGDEFFGGLIGISFEMPIGNRAGEAGERRARIEARAAALRYEELARDVVKEVKDALRQLRTNYELVGATRSFRIAQSENLRALEAEAERRASLTPEFLRLRFDRQERLARAQLDELQAVANFSRALAAYRRAVGEGQREQ